MNEQINHTINVGIYIIAELKESCSDEYFNASCTSRGGGGDVILMESAAYGRMRAGRCVSTNIGCSIDVLEFIEGQCSGRRQCSVYVSDINLQRMAPCSKEFTSYLETKHTCLNGMYARVSASISVCWSVYLSVSGSVSV